MPLWWGKSSSKEVKKKANRESIIDTIQRKLKNASEEKHNNKSGRSRRHRDDAISKKGSTSLGPSRSSSPSTHVSRCQSFAEMPHSQPLPLPEPHLTAAIGANSGLTLSSKVERAIGSKPSGYFPLPKPGFVSNKEDLTDAEVDIATASVSSDSSLDSDNSFDSPHLVSPLASDCENGNTATIDSSFRWVYFLLDTFFLNALHVYTFSCVPFITKFISMLLNCCAQESITYYCPKKLKRVIKTCFSFVQ